MVFCSQIKRVGTMKAGGHEFWDSESYIFGSIYRIKPKFLARRSIFVTEFKYSISIREQ